MSNLRKWSERRHGDKRSIFPHEVVSDITIYTRYTDAQSGLCTNIRHVLKGCVWSENAAEVGGRSGALGSDIQIKVSARIPYLSKYSGVKYLSAERWAVLPVDELGKYWTVNIFKPPLICNGDIDFMFGWGDEKAVALREASLTQQNHINYIPGIRRVKDIREIIYGISSDFTEDENYERNPGKFSVMGDMWNILLKC